MRSPRLHWPGGILDGSRRLAICILIIDSGQIIALVVLPTSGAAQGLSTSFAPPSMGAFWHVFLGNAFFGLQELVPVYSLFALSRSLYLLLTSVTLLEATWNVSRLEVVLRLFAFAYAWLETSTYSFAVMRSFSILGRVRSKSLSARYLLSSSVIVIGGLAVAAVLETMALMVV